MATSEGCSNCGSAAAGADGLCKPCRIEEEQGPEAKARYYANIGRKGGHARGKKGLDADELPDLRTRSDAKIWLEAIGRAVAVGRLANKQAQAAIRAVEAWLKAEAEHEVAEDLEAVKERLQEVQEQVQANRTGESRLQSVP